MESQINFNSPFISGNEIKYIKSVLTSKKISGNGIFTQKCQAYFNSVYKFKKSLFTTSCTDALEMAAILAEIEPGDEVIMPSYTFVSTAIAFIRQGARVIFLDSRDDHPGVNESEISKYISEKTKAIVVVHYAGIACDMNLIMELANKHNLIVIEDAAQALGSFYKEKPLGSIGHLAAFSFHETKNITSGEGGLLAINDEKYLDRSEIIWEKGTNRAKFFRGEIDKYGWVDIGSSFLQSELNAAFLWAQIESFEQIQNKRKRIWNTYYHSLKSCEIVNKHIRLPIIPDFSKNNYHMFYMILKSEKVRSKLISFLAKNKVKAVFHYQTLHNSRYYNNLHDGRILPNAELYQDKLLRLPLYADLSEKDAIRITDLIKQFFS